MLVAGDIRGTENVASDPFERSQTSRFTRSGERVAGMKEYA